jgi:hypothetical protein
LDPKLPVRKSADLHSSPSAVGAEYHLGLPCFTTTSATWWFTACCCLLVCGAIATPHLVFSCTHIVQAIVRDEVLACLACGLATSNSAVSELGCKQFSFGSTWLKSPVPPVNLLALVLALVIHYHEKVVERKTKDCVRSMSQNRGSPSEKREVPPPGSAAFNPFAARTFLGAAWWW